MTYLEKGTSDLHIVESNGALSVQAAFNFGSVLIATAAVFVLIFRMVPEKFTGTPSSLKDFKSNAVHVTLGFLFLASVIPFFRIINKDFTRDNLPSPTATLSESSAPSQTIGTVSSSQPGAWGPQAQADFSRIQREEAAMRKKFADAGLTINKSPCTQLGQQSCTTVGGLPESIIPFLLSLKSACGCDVVLNGGTEFWLHKSHGVDKSIIDLSNNAGDKSYKLNIFLKKQPAATKNVWSICSGTYQWNNYTFCNEYGTHWHVQSL